VSLVLLMSLALASGCRFDSSGMLLRDRSVPLSELSVDVPFVLRDAGPDGRGERGDLALDGPGPHDQRPWPDKKLPPDLKPPPDLKRPPDLQPKPDAQKSCDTLYGAAPGYQLCEETAASCKLNASTSGSNCKVLCASLGGTCLAAFDNDSGCNIISWSDTCETNRSTEICECSR